MPCDYSKYPPNWKSEIRPRILATAGSVAKAESEALVEVERLLEVEQQADAEYKAAYLLLEHGRDVLSSMVQHLSHLKQEKRAETYGQGSQNV